MNYNNQQNNSNKENYIYNNNGSVIKEIKSKCLFKSYNYNYFI